MLQPLETRRTTGVESTIRERRRLCRRTNKIQLCLGKKEEAFVDTCSHIQGLIKSNQRNEQQLGVQLLSDIYKTTPERRRECLYYLALGNYKLGNYAEARKFNDKLVELEPGNLQAASLRQLIEDKVSKEGMMGMAIIGGAAVVAGIVGGMLMRGSRKR
jgi:mitochondrial fission 1 protein